MTASIEWTFDVTAIIEKLLNDSMELKNNSFLWTTNTKDIRIDWKKKAEDGKIYLGRFT